MTRPADPARPDVYARITRRILRQLESGVRPWTRPWSAQGSASRPLRHDGKPYNGVNVLLLWSEAAERGYLQPTWMTFRQAFALGAVVRKGERGTTVVYANTVTRTETGASGEDTERRFGFLKAYTVFNVEQIDGLPDRYAPEPAPAVNPNQRLPEIQSFFGQCGAHVRHGGGMAFYAPGSDRVQMPEFEAFESAAAYYATLGHEMIHWTRHSSRLDRDFGRQRHGDVGYAREELVAEIGAAFLCADLGLTLEPREDHAAYLASWLEVLSNDTRFIVSAAAHAQRATDFLHGLQSR